MATSRSENWCQVIPAIHPIADAGGARVRFPGLRRLDPQLRAIVKGAPSHARPSVRPGRSTPGRARAPPVDYVDKHPAAEWPNFAPSLWPNFAPPLTSIATVASSSPRAVFFSGLSIFFRRSVNSDSSRPSCRRLRFGFFSHEMTVSPHVIRGMSADAKNRCSSGECRFMR